MNLYINMLYIGLYSSSSLGFIFLRITLAPKYIVFKPAVEYIITSKGITTVDPNNGNISWTIKEKGSMKKL